jgi:hypothetical protein
MSSFKKSSALFIALSLILGSVAGVPLQGPGDNSGNEDHDKHLDTSLPAKPDSLELAQKTAKP